LLGAAAGDEPATPKVGDKLPDGTVISQTMVDDHHKQNGTAEGDPDHSWIDDRFGVKNDEGVYDFEAIAKKTAEAYENAEKALKKRKNRAPESPDGYVKEGIPEGIEVSDDIWEFFHEADLNNDQAHSVLAKMQEVFLPQLTEKHLELEAVKLQNTWGLEGDVYAREFEKVAKWAVNKFGEGPANTFGANAQGMNSLREMMVGEVAGTSVNVFNDTAPTGEDKYAEMDGLLREATALEAKGDAASIAKANDMRKRAYGMVG
jgi:hypothetical protein